MAGLERIHTTEVKLQIAHHAVPLHGPPERRVRKVDPAPRGDDNVIGTIEALTAVRVGQHLELASLEFSHDAARSVLTGDESARTVVGVPDRVVARFAVDLDATPRPTEHLRSGDVAEDERPPGSMPHRSLEEAESSGHLFQWLVADNVVEARVAPVV